MSSLLERTLGGIRNQGESTANRRTSGGGQRSSPYSRPEGAWSHDKYSNNDAPADSARPRPSARQEGKSAKLAISNVHYEVSERELELLFVQIGPIASGPKIRFDKSGRSTGLAWVTFSDEEHAAQAKEAFDGALAKGQEIKVDFDYRLDARHERGAPAPGTLLARLESDNRRPSDRDSRAPRDAPRGPRVSSERGMGAGRGAERGARGGRGGGRGGREPRAPRPAKTTDDLDAELEAFMAAPVPAKVAPAAAAAPAASADVEMS